MKVMVIVKATKESESGVFDPEHMKKMMSEMMKFNEELVKAKIMLDGDGMKPTSKAVRIRFNGADRTVIPGPFLPATEQLAGYWIWEVKSLDEAIAWAKRCPNPMPGESELEIRPYNTFEDFGDAVTPEIIAKMEQLEAEGAKYKK